jgi:hypothetical protein
MRIQNIRSDQGNGRRRIAATVTWEDNDRPRRDVYFEVDESFAGDLAPDPHAFLVACLVPAMRHCEQRVAIDEPICPELLTGLRINMGWLSQWSGQCRGPVKIEAKPEARLPAARAAECAASFLSGGVDSLALLRENRLRFPPEHPRSIKDCLIVHGFDMGGVEATGAENEAFEQAVKTIAPIAADAQAQLVPIHTNVRHLDSDVIFWMYEFAGAAMASVAHALSRRLSLVYFASALDIPHLTANVSVHPLLDNNYSSANLQVRHDGVQHSRLDKVRLLADWDVALQALRVCTLNPPGMLNCGKCEKCIRTMLELLAVGKLAGTQAFPTDNVSAELLGTIDFQFVHEEAYFLELIDPLLSIGRPDLVRVIEIKSKEFRKRLAWEEERDWKGFVKRFDRKCLGSSMYKSYKSLRALSIAARN